MDKDLELLVELQKIDSEIKELQKQIADWQQKKLALEEQAQQSQKVLAQAKSNQEENTKQRRKSERELEAKEEEIKKYKGQLINVKTNKEYQSLQHEIENAQQQNGQIEEDILKVMDSTEALNQAVKQREAGLKQVQAQIKEQGQQMDQEINQRQLQWENLTKERDKVKAKVDPKMLTNYERLLKHKGLAMAAVINEVCQGCFMHIPPQTYETLKKKNKIYYCQSCHRMLYVK